MKKFMSKALAKWVLFVVIAICFVMAIINFVEYSAILVYSTPKMGDFVKFVPVFEEDPKFTITIMDGDVKVAEVTDYTGFTYTFE